MAMILQAQWRVPSIRTRSRLLAMRSKKSKEVEAAFLSLEPEERVRLVRVIAVHSYVDAVQMIGTRAVLKSYEATNPLILAGAGASRAAHLVRLALVDRIVITVERALAPLGNI